MSDNGNQAVAEAAEKLAQAQAAAKPNRKQRRTAAHAGTEAAPPPAIFSPEWLEASIRAQAQETQKYYDAWQQSQGALAIMQAQLNLLNQQEQKAKADDTSTD